MASGDWVSGTHIEFDTSSSVTFTATAVSIGATYWVVLPSGSRIWNPGGVFPYTADPSQPILTEFRAMAQALANRENVTVYMPDGSHMVPA